MMFLWWVMDMIQFFFSVAAAGRCVERDRQNDVGYISYFIDCYFFFPARNEYRLRHWLNLKLGSLHYGKKKLKSYTCYLLVRSVQAYDYDDNSRWWWWFLLFFDSRLWRHTQAILPVFLFILHNMFTVHIVLLLLLHAPLTRSSDVDLFRFAFASVVVGCTYVKMENNWRWTTQAANSRKEEKTVNRWEWSGKTATKFIFFFWCWSINFCFIQLNDILSIHFISFFSLYVVQNSREFFHGSTMHLELHFHATLFKK